MMIHIVRPGETITAIAQNYGVDPVRLASDNAVPPSGALAVGQTLVLRFPRTIHVVRPGETLTAIARDYGVSVRQLWRNNWNLHGSSSLFPEQALVISYFEEPLGTAECNGYAYPFIDRDLLHAQLPYLTDLTPFTYGIAENGDLLPLADDALLSAARAQGVRPVLHLSTLTEDGQFDTGRAARLLSDFSMQEHLMDQVLQTAALRGYAGVDVDFEYLPGTLAQEYAAFLGRLRRRLTSQGRFLWAALAPKTSAGQPGLLYEGHDYAAVAAASDAVLLMTYGWGTVAHKPKTLENQGLLRDNIC